MLSSARPPCPPCPPDAAAGLAGRSPATAQLHRAVRSAAPGPEQDLPGTVALLIPVDPKADLRANDAVRNSPTVHLPAPRQAPSIGRGGRAKGRPGPGQVAFPVSRAHVGLELLAATNVAIYTACRVLRRP
jgi:hypothetical protein